MSAYRINALPPRARQPMTRGAVIGLSMAAAAAAAIAVASAIASVAALGGAGASALLAAPAWSAASIAASLVLCGGLIIAGVAAADRWQRRTALLAATLWLVAGVGPWHGPSLVAQRWGGGCDLGDAAEIAIHAGSTRLPVLLFLLGLCTRSAAWLAVSAVPLVYLRPYARSALPAVATAAIGLVTIAAYLRAELVFGAGTTLSFAALAFALATALRARRSPTLADGAASVDLDAADRSKDAAAYDAFASGRLRDAMYAVVACTTAFALETASFGIVATGTVGTALTTLALLVTLERVRRRAKPRTSIVPVLAAATSLILLVGVAFSTSRSSQHFLRDAAVLAFAVAVLGLMLALPAPVAARGTEARRLMFMLGALALTLLVSAMLGLVSAPHHGQYSRAPGTIFMSVFDGAALAFAIIAARRAAALEAHARTRMAARARREGEAG